MKLGRIVLAGILGGVLVVAIVFIAGLASGVDADLCALLGAATIGTGGPLAWTIGAVAQLVVAVICALVYATIFEWVTRRAGALIGLGIGLAHAVIAGLAVGFLPARRLLNSGAYPPGAFLEYRGLIVAGAFVAAHLVFGAIVGALYGATQHVGPRLSAVWTDATVNGP